MNSVGLILEAELSGKEGKEEGEGESIKRTLISAWQAYGDGPYQSAASPLPPHPPSPSHEQSPPVVSITSHSTQQWPPPGEGPGAGQSPPPAQQAPVHPVQELFPLKGGAAEGDEKAVEAVASTTKRPKSDKKYAVSWARQFAVLTQRGFRNAAVTQLNPLPILQMVLVALIVGLIWIDQRTLTQANVRDRVGAVFFIGLFAGGFTPAINAVHTGTISLSLLSLLSLSSLSLSSSSSSIIII